MTQKSHLVLSAPQSLSACCLVVGLCMYCHLLRKEASLMRVGGRSANIWVLKYVIRIHFIAVFNRIIVVDFSLGLMTYLVSGSYFITKCQV